MSAALGLKINGLRRNGPIKAARAPSAIARLSSAGLPVQVFGDDGWVRAGIVAPEQFEGFVDPQQLPQLYRRSRVNLNLNFMQVASTVNPKVLDAYACGATVVTDGRPELEELFPDPSRRPFAFSSLDELPDLIADLLRLDLMAHRQAVGAYTRQHHTLMHRARYLAEQLGLADTQGCSMLPGRSELAREETSLAPLFATKVAPTNTKSCQIPGTLNNSGRIPLP